MEKRGSFIDKLNNKLMPMATKLGNEKHLQSISEGMMFGLPFLVIGSFFLIFANPPINIDTYNPKTANFFMQFLASWKYFAVDNYETITIPYNLTMGIIGFISAFGIGYSLAKKYKMDSSMNGMISAIIFLIVSTPVHNNKISLEYLGTNGLFVAIIIGLLTVEINRFFIVKNIAFKMPESVPKMVTTFLNTLLPLLTNILIFYSINLIFIATTHKVFPAAVMAVLTPATNVAGSLWGFILIVTLGNVLWLFGVNGSSIIFPIIFTLGVSQTGMNAAQFAAGDTMTHLMNLQMFRISVLGGAGGTLGLVILMMISKVPEYKTIGRLSLIPGICSINEPIIFGFPIVLNPIMAIPFIATPIVSLFLTYFAQKFGLIGLGLIVDPSFTPFFVQSYLSSMDWRNIVFSLVLILVSVLIYYPFFKIAEKNRLAAEAL